MAGPLLGVVPLAARLPLLRPLGCEMLSQLWGQTVPSRLLPCSSLPFERPAWAGASCAARLGDEVPPQLSQEGPQAADFLL